MGSIEAERNRKPLFFGWDVGAWHCDDKRGSQDALVALDFSGETLGNSWRGNLREAINIARSSEDFANEILGLCKTGRNASRCHITMAIDAPLGFPVAFERLILDGTTVEEIAERAAGNPYLFRVTERRLTDEPNMTVADKKKLTPLSSITDRIGSQATKAMHVVRRFARVRKSRGVWTDEACLTMIETYPTLVQSRLGLKKRSDGKEMSDIRDAKICAKVAWDFRMNRDSLEHPTEDAPCSEGWIWAPRRHMEAARKKQVG